MSRTNVRVRTPPMRANGGGPRVRARATRGGGQLSARALGVVRRWGAGAARRPVALAVVALVALGVALRLWLIARGWPDLDSDEAIVGLMGRHILYAGERPVFYYGQHYQGAVDGYLAALAFAVLGPTTLAFRLLLLLLTIPMLLAGYALGRAAYSTAVGLLTLAYLALGPAFGLLTEVGDIGGYHDDAVLGAVLCLLVYAELRRPVAWRDRADGRARWTATARYALMGAVAGLGLWSDQLILPVVGAALLVLLVARPGALRRPPLAGLAVGGALGMLPLLIANVQNPGITWVELAAQSRDSHVHGLLPAITGFVQQVGQTLMVGLPAVLGSPHVCISQGGGWHAYPVVLWSSGATSAACGGINALFALGVLACFGVGTWQLVWTSPPTPPLRGEGSQSTRSREGSQSSRRAYSRATAVRRWGQRAYGMTLLWRGGMGWGGREAGANDAARAVRAEDVAGDQARRERAAQLWLRAMLLLAAVGTLLLYTLSRTAFTYSFTAARYLLPLYTALPLVFGVLWAAAEPLVTRAWQRWATVRTTHSLPGLGTAPRTTKPQARAHDDRRRVMSWNTGMVALAAAGLVLLLGFALYGAGATLTYASDGSRWALPAPPADQRLMATLDDHHITRYISDYWTCYRLVFESGERLRCGVRDGVNNTLTHNGAVNRYLPYLLEVERTPHPAYIFAAGSAWDAGFIGWAAAQHLPHAGYTRLVVAGYAIYYYPGGQG